jgi:hypothetical protein
MAYQYELTLNPGETKHIDFSEPADKLKFWSGINAIVKPRGTTGTALSYTLRFYLGDELQNEIARTAIAIDNYFYDHPPLLDGNPQTGYIRVEIAYGGGNPNPATFDIIFNPHI